MRKCLKCGAENEDNNVFCEKCGQRIEDFKQENVNNEEKANLDKNQFVHSSENSYENNENLSSKDNEKKGFNKKKLIAIPVAILLVLAVYLAYSTVKKMAIETDPGKKVLSGLSNLSHNESFDQTIKFTLEDAGQDPSAQMLNGGSVEIRQRKLGENKIQGDFDVYLGENKFFGLNILLDSNNLVINIPTIFDKPLYIKADSPEDLLSKIKNNLMFLEEKYNGDFGDLEALDEMAKGQEEYKKAMNKLKEIFDVHKYDSYKKVDVDKYSKLISSILEQFINIGQSEQVAIGKGDNEKEIKCSSVEFKLNQENLDEVLVEVKKLLGESIEDDNLKEFINDLGVNYLDTIKELNFAMEPEAKEEIEEIKEAFNNEFNKGYAEGLKELIDEIDGYLKLENEEDVFDISGEMYFDSKNTLRKLISDIMIDADGQSTKFNIEYTVNALGKGIVFDEFDLENGMDITVLDEEKVNTIYTTIMFKMMMLQGI